MTETINFTVDSEDIKTFEEKTGLKFVDGMKLLMDNLKYGGNFGLDPFWSEENQTGKPEPLKGDKSGWWSVRIDEKNRLIFKIENEVVEITQCGTHYGEK